MMLDVPYCNSYGIYNAYNVAYNVTSVNIKVLHFVMRPSLPSMTSDGLDGFLKNKALETPGLDGYNDPC